MYYRVITYYYYIYRYQLYLWYFIYKREAGFRELLPQTSRVPIYVIYFIAITYLRMIVTSITCLYISVKCVLVLKRYRNNNKYNDGDDDNNDDDNNNNWVLRSEKPVTPDVMRLVMPTTTTNGRRAAGFLFGFRIYLCLHPTTHRTTHRERSKKMSIIRRGRTIYHHHQFVWCAVSNWNVKLILYATPREEFIVHYNISQPERSPRMGIIIYKYILWCV